MSPSKQMSDPRTPKNNRETVTKPNTTTVPDRALEQHGPLRTPTTINAGRSPPRNSVTLSDFLARWRRDRSR